MQEPILQVGIVSGKYIPFILNKPYQTENGNTFVNEQKVELSENKILFNNKLYNELILKSNDINKSFILPKVKIGIDFHWERIQKEKFQGDLKFIIEGNNITIINIIPIEQYLSSVISSEMNANSSEELLKAHTVISRSWVLAQLQNKGKNKNKSPFIINQNEIIKWADREDHENFDVCADDHCQRYEGITEDITAQVKNAIAKTTGQVLKNKKEICDTRFSKCCGGMLEEYQNCWEDSPKEYLKALRDNNTIYMENGNLLDLTYEDNAEKWILSNPKAFCNTSNQKILSQTLNTYDTETKDFYRWKVEYTVEEISQLIKSKTNIDFGTIQDFIPIERGKSGRLVKLKIIGDKKTITIGKELEIRKALSKTHLYSSAIIIKKVNDKFIIHGAGWGHGVGLCQIGAAVMGEYGYNYKEILTHYYPNTSLSKIY